MLLDLIKIAFIRIKNRLLESIIVILSLGFGLAIVSTVFGSIITFNDEMNEFDNSKWKREISIMPLEYSNNQYKTVEKLGTQKSLEIEYFTGDEIDRFRDNCPTIKYAIIEDWVSLVEDSESQDDINWWEYEPRANGINQDYINFNGFEIEEGSYFNKSDYENGNNVIILGGNLKTLLFQDTNPVGKRLTYDNIGYEVIGYFKEKYDVTDTKVIEDIRSNKWDENNRVYLPYTTKNWNRDKNKVEYFILGVDESVDIKKAIEEVKLFINTEYKESSIKVGSYLDWDNDYANTTKKILKIIAFIAMVSLIISTLTCLNLMLARVIRDKKGLGISQALGATKKTVFISTLIESLIIGFIGTLLGFGLMTIFIIIISEILGSGGSIVNTFLSLNNFIITSALALLVTGLFSFFPAFEALKIQPSQVLRED